MRKRTARTAARRRAAVLLLLLGIGLPSLMPRGGMSLPAPVEELLKETLAGETPVRSAYVRTACALVDRVGYFWGGKSHALGWDKGWGWPRRVTATGSGTTGRIRPYGLDCSGLVSWAAAAALGDSAAYDRIGEGVRDQYARCEPTEDPRPGDLAFFPDLSHVGVVLGRDSGGTLWVVHCSSSLGGVVVTPGSYGFGLYGVPAIFSGEGP